MKLSRRDFMRGATAAAAAAVVTPALPSVLSGVDVGVAPMTSLTVFSTADFTFNFSTGRILEFVVFDRGLTEEEIQKITGHMKDHYGIVSPEQDGNVVLSWREGDKEIKQC